MPELDPNNYTIAWIAPIAIEWLAAKHMLDKVHPGLFPDDDGDYSYLAGTMCGHNVVIATFPDFTSYGRAAAAALASHLKTNFRSLRFGLLVGIAAGLPLLSASPPRDIRLGARRTNDNATIQGWSIAATANRLGSAIGEIRSEAPDDAALFVPYYDAMKDREHGGDDEGEELVARPPRADKRRTRVWYGPLGSGESLMKNPRERDALRDRYNVYGLEMEAAGVMDVIPNAVVRGVSDYADEHKDDAWQPYAAAMAAAYAKAVLSRIPVSRAVPSKAAAVADEAPAPKKNVSKKAASRRQAESANDDEDEDDDDNAGEEYNDHGAKVSIQDNVRGAHNQFYSGHFNGATFNT